MDTANPSSTIIMMILMFVLCTIVFIVVILAFTNEKFRDRILGLLPFSNKKEGSKQIPFFMVILIIVGAMVIAYFF